MTETGSYFSSKNVNSIFQKKTRLLENQSTAPTTRENFNPGTQILKECSKSIKSYTKKQAFFNTLFILQQLSFILLQSSTDFFFFQAVQSAVLASMHLYTIKCSLVSAKQRLSKASFGKVSSSVERVHDCTLYSVILYFLSLVLTVSSGVVHVGLKEKWDDLGMKSVMIGGLLFVSVLAQLMLISDHNKVKVWLDDLDEEVDESPAVV